MDELFQTMIGIGIVLCIGTGFIVVTRGDSPPGRTFGDLLDAKHNWKELITIGVALMVVGLVGQIVT